MPSLSTLAVTAGALASGVAGLRAPTDKPNVVMFFVDDLGYGDTNFNGHPTTLTPNLDKLAYGGKILSAWYSGCPVCSGSRGALMTGRQYNRIGIPGTAGAPRCARSTAIRPLRCAPASITRPHSHQACAD